MGREGHGCLVYIKYTWSIRNCATCCNIPALLSCRSLVAFNLKSSINKMGKTLITTQQGKGTTGMKVTERQKLNVFEIKRLGSMTGVSRLDRVSDLGMK